MITKSHSLEKEGGFFSVENLWIAIFSDIDMVENKNSPTKYRTGLWICG